MWTKYIPFALISLLPILGWAWFFQRQHPEKRWYLFLTFVAGMLAVVPIKLYEKYWDIAVWKVQHFNIFQYITDLIEIPSLSRLLAFISISVFVAFGFFIFIATMMFILEIATGDNTVDIFRRKLKKVLESPFFFVSIGVLFGLIAFFFSELIPSKIWFFIIVGMLEEFIKFLVLRFSDEEKIVCVADAISFAVVTALGFSFVENALYLANFWDISGQDSAQFIMFFVLRSTVSVLAHVSFSAILAYFYGIAHFSKEIYQTEVLQNRHPIIHLLHNVLHLKGSTLFHEQKMMEGMLIAMIIHAIFNSLLEFGQVPALIPFLLLLFFLILYLLHQSELNIRFGRIELPQKNLQSLKN